MSIIFVSSVDGSDADNGSTWALAKATITGALAIAADLDVIKVSHLHNFVAGAAITWTLPAGSVTIISVNRAGSDAWLAGAAESIGAANAAFAFAPVNASSMFIFGMSLTGGTTTGTSSDITFTGSAAIWRLEMWNCTFDLPNTSTGAQYSLSGSTARSNVLIFRDCTFGCSGSRAGTLFNIGGASITMINPTFSMGGATKPAILFAFVLLADGGEFTIRDGDISGYAVSGGKLFDLTQLGKIHILLENLKMSATPVLTTGSWAGYIADITLRNCDSGDTINVFEYHNMFGDLTEDAAFATGGAAFNGTGVSWKVVTTALCSESFPFQLPPLSVWSIASGATSATVEIAQASGAGSLTDRDIWLGIDYPSDASFPGYTAVTDRNTNPFTGSAVNQTASAIGWTGISSPVQQKCHLGSFTPLAVGLIKGRISVAKASLTVWVDPKLKVA